MEHFVSGMSGGTVSTLILHPLDLIKLRFAVHDGLDSSVHRPKYRGIIHAFFRIRQEEGLRVLYRGVSASMIGNSSSWGLYFFFYNAFKSQLQSGNVDHQLSTKAHIACASMTGCLTLAMTNPIWVVKTRLCLKDNSALPNHMRYHHFRDGIYKLVKYEGISGMYKGFIPGLIGVSHGVVQFVTYDEMKKYYCNFNGVPISSKLGTVHYLTMAALSKFVAVTTTYPYQVVRARLQDQHGQYSGIMDIIIKISRYEGVVGFYKGLLPSIIKVTPATCITFVVYEHLSKFLSGLRTQQ
ncbi:solute carrier family 25 member 32-like [Dysidea avara]|uniref:solute carrier family 25 member 32-like n=1 Tax=Dysidea avara TaxID=196820 RepID=UPI0033300A9B